MTRDGRGAGDEVADTKDPLPVKSLQAARLPVKYLGSKSTSSHPRSYFVFRLSVTYGIV